MLPSSLISLIVLFCTTAKALQQIPLQEVDDSIQTPLEFETLHHSDHGFRTTLVDLLAADKQYSHLVFLLQRARLIPTLNRLNHGATLFAPTNTAIERAAQQETDPIWSQALNQADLKDNINSRLRQTLLYHLLNVTLPIVWNVTDTPVLLPTMLFPHPMAGHEKPGGPFPDSPEIHSSLGNASQVIRLTAKAIIDSVNTTIYVGGDAQGNGGIAVNSSKIVTGSNAVIFPLEDGVLSPPKSIGHIMRTHPALQQIRSLYSEEALHRLDNQSHLTLFAPADEAWEQLDDLEKRYLRSGFAQGDLKEIFEDHSVDQPLIGYVDQLVAQGEAMTTANHTLGISRLDGKLWVNESTATETDILASNGVVHIIDRLLLPAGALQLTAEKYLLALNCTKFVSLLREAGLSDKVQHSNESYTILAPKDDVFADWQEWARLPTAGSHEMRDLLQYHLVHGPFLPRDLQDGLLLNTTLHPSKLNGESQKLQAFKAGKKEDEYTIGFGNANVLGDPIPVGSSVIYLVSQVLQPPEDFIQVAMTDLRLSTFVAAIYAAGLDKRLKHTAASTLFAPINSAFDQLGLAMSYFLLPGSIQDLKSLIRYHFLDQVAYLQELQSANGRYRTLEGSDLSVHQKNGDVLLSGPTINGYPVSGQIGPINITSGDLLTASGVAHVVDSLILPPTIHLSNRKLLQGAKAETMTSLIKLANMTWVLDGQDRPVKAKTSQLAQGKSYTLLAPSDRAFNKINLTYYENNLPALKELIELHIIPQDTEQVVRHGGESMQGRPLALEDGAELDSLLSRRQGGTSHYGTLAFRNMGDAYLVGIKGARGSVESEYAHVTGFGRATPRLSLSEMRSKRKWKGKKSLVVNGGGVFAIDTVLIPYRPDWFHRWGWIVVIVFLSLIGAVCLGLLGYKLYRGRKEQQYEPLDGEES